MKIDDLRFVFVTCCFFFSLNLLGQNSEKRTYSFLGKTRVYYVLQPTDRVKGIFLLFPGKGEKANELFAKTKLPEVLKSQGYVTIIPELEYALFVNESLQKQIKEIIRIENGKVRTQNLSLGGFSAGGSVALSFAEHLLRLDSTWNLRSVFVIDPPIDLHRIYISSQQLMKYKCKDIIYREGAETKAYLDRTLGSPQDSLQNYIGFSPFLSSQPDGGNANVLKRIPIRLYTEPDLNFVRYRFCPDLTMENLNVTDLEKLNNVLIKGGNKNCEYIVTQGRGYHSWNIIEPNELAGWILSYTK